MPTELSQSSTLGGVNVFRRLVQTRGFSLFLLLVVATPLVVGLGAWSAMQRFELPDPGLTVNDRGAVEMLDERMWPGARRGDRIVEVDGAPVRSTAHWFAVATSGGARSLTLTFERGERRWSTTAATSPIRIEDRLAVWARILTGTIVMVFGLLAFVARPGPAVTWLLLILSWVLGVVLLLKIGLYWDPTLERQVATYPWMVLVSVGLHFFCFFPRRIAWMAGAPVRVFLLYVPLGVAPVVHLLGLEARMVQYGALWAAFATAATTVLLFVQYRHVRRANDAHARSQYNALLVGFTGGLVVPGVWNAVRMSFGIWAGPWSAHYNAIPVVLFIGMITYAVIRHNALAIDRFTATVVGYATTTVVLGGVFAAGLVGIPLLLGESGLADSPIVLVTVTALTFAGFSPLYRRIKRWVDRRFFRVQADAAQMAAALRELVRTMQKGGRSESVRAAMKASGILGTERVSVWLLSEEGENAQLVRYGPGGGGSAAEDAPVRLDSPLGRALRTGIAAGVQDLSPHTMESAAQEELWTKELAVAAPVMVHAVVAGFIGLGRKRSGVGYQLEELSYLSIVAAQLGGALERAQIESAHIGRYHLERRLGTGGMAEVFLAWQVGPGGFERRVALKRPLPHLVDDPNAVASFLDEARLAAQLSHVNIASVYDVGESEGTYFIVMEHVDGPSLRDVLRRVEERDGRVPLVIAVGIIADVLAALDYAHRHTDPHGRELQLVHRDITPRNVLLNRRGEVKLVDFGIARAQHRLHVTQTGQVKGTLPYMSPEQAAADEIDHRSDLYSTSVLLYELLTGKRPFPEGPTGRLPDPITDAVQDVPTELEPVLERAMAWSAQERYPSAVELRGELLAAISPRQPAGRETIARWLSMVCPPVVRIHDPAVITVPMEQTDDTIEGVEGGTETVVAEPGE